MIGRQAGYARMATPITPSRRKGSQDSSSLGGHKIVHLGPISPYSALAAAGLQRPVSPGGTGGSSHSSSQGHGNHNQITVRIAAREMIVKSPMLIRTTYRRIRLIQHLMGYRDLLPLGSDGEFEEEHPDDDSETKWWSNKDALEAVVQETKDLSDEFQDYYDTSGGVGDESMVMVDSDMTPQESTTSLLGHDRG